MGKVTVVSRAMSRAALAGACALAVVAGAVAPADAAIFTYDFTVSVTAGPLNGQTASGRFSYDSTNTGFFVGLLTDLSFTFNGIAYTEASANTGNLFTNPDGTLSSVQFGNQCGIFCSLSTSGNTFWVSGGQFAYSMPTINDFFRPGGTVSYSQVTAVPEPATAAILGVGLLGLGLMRRRAT